MARLLFRDITKLFDHTIVAVSHFSLEVEDGEFMVLVGPSGCGKTTVLRIVAGLEEPTSGEIYIGERLVNDVPPKDRDVAMVFQNYALYPHMRVYDNIAFGLRLRELKGWGWQLLHWHEARQIRRRIEERVREAAQMLGIESVLHRRPKELSGGQRQRVALARAIVRKPKLFLMDEPLSNLDAKLRDQTRAELKKLQESLGVTTLYVTHDQKEAMTLGHRIAVMKEGVLQQVDTPEKVYQKPANLFVAGFIGTPPMNFFEATLKAEQGTVWIETGAFKVPLSGDQATLVENWIGQPVIFGIRPQDIGICQSTSGSKAASGSPPIQTEVEVVEPQGDRTDLHLKAGELRFIAQVDSMLQVKEGERIPVALNLARAHLFDKQSEQAIF